MVLVQLEHFGSQVMHCPFWSTMVLRGQVSDWLVVFVSDRESVTVWALVGVPAMLAVSIVLLLVGMD
jgi:hypothetical protein